MGTTQTGANATIATVWNRTTPTALSGLGGTQSSAYGVNNTGQVVGYSMTTGNVSAHAVIWNGGVLTDLNPTGSLNSSAVAINNTGVAVGWTDFTGVEIATIWNGTTPTYLGTLPGMLESTANSINDAGVVVGYNTSFSSPASLGVIWDGTTPINLSTLLDSSDASWIISEAFAINDAGDIVAQGYDTVGSTAFQGTALLLTPCETCTPIGGAAVGTTPLPAALPLFATGLGALLGWRRKRKNAVPVHC